MTNRYTASQIIERALNLADLSNTDFLTHDELTRYVNDAWTSVYNWLIKVGDTTFIKEAILVNPSTFNGYTEYELPEDLYIIKSIKNQMSGSLVPRHAESESINSGTYDIVNDRLRLYGVQSNPLLLTYWMTPTYISFPDKDVEVEENLDGAVSSCSNSILFDDGKIFNCITGQTLGGIGDLDNNYTYVLGVGHIFRYNASSWKYFDYKGNILEEGNGSVDHTFLTDNGYVGFQLMSDSELTPPIVFRKQISSLNDYIVAKSGNHLISFNNEDRTFEVFYYDEYKYKVYLPTFTGSAEVIPIEDFDNHDTFIIKLNEIYYQLTLHDKGYDLIELDIDVFDPIKMLKYGIAFTDGLNNTVRSWIPDTELNFPTNMYFSLIACDLAMRFLLKQNASTDSINALYQNMQMTFSESLNANSDPVRIKNVYC